jgi:ribosome-associated toxin RatA of RatAB toxin-antitoxin module
MAVVTKEMVVDVPVERFFEIVVDYERYPEFVPGIRRCRVKEADGEKRVEYELDLGIRRIKYVLRHEEQRPRKVSWSLVSGDMMKVSNGSWELAADGTKTRATYSVDIQISRPPLVPQALVDRVSHELTRVQLPRTLDAFKARAEEKR